MSHTITSTESNSDRARIAKPLAAAILIFGVFGGMVFAFGQSEDGRTSVGEVGRRIVEFAEHCESAGFSGAVLAARKGAVVAAVGVGSADLDGKVPKRP